MNGKKGHKNLKRNLNVSKFRLVGLDSNIFIYQLQGNPIFGPIVKNSIFSPLLKNQLSAVTSTITLTEVLSLQSPLSQIEGMQELLLGISNLTFFDVSQEIAMKAAEIRRDYKIRLPDAIQLATAKLAKAQAFITNDQRLKIFKELKVLSLKDI